MAGARTRVVWLQDVDRAGDVFSRSSRKVIIGLDSDDANGEHFIVSEPGYFTKPLITPEGDRVVYSDFHSHTVWVAAWDGSKQEKFADGMAIETWIDPKTSVQWVYVLRGPEENAEYENNPLYRHRLDDPETFELVWDQTPISGLASGSFQLSADGARAAGLFPWPEAGMIDFEKGTWDRVGDGCWTSLSPDNTYRYWIFDGAHRNLLVGSPGGGTTARINLSFLAAEGRGEVYHPRWSNFPRIFTFTSPYFLQKGKAVAGGPQVEVYVGRFNESFTKIESWVEVTRNVRGDYFPDVWVDRDPLEGQPAGSVGNGGTSEELEARWPGDRGGLVFRWENAGKKNAVYDTSAERERLFRLRTEGFAHYGRYQVMEFFGNGGRFVLSDSKPLPFDPLQSGYGMTLEATLTPASAADGPVPVITFHGDGARQNFVLTQEGSRLLFRLSTREQGEPSDRRLDLGPITPGRSTHVAITYDVLGGSMAGFLDGAEVNRTEGARGDFESWTAGPLEFGGTGSGGRSWSGKIDGVAIYDMSLDPQQIAWHAQLNRERIAGRKPAARTIVQARLTEVTRAPMPSAIAPYRRCLVIYRYSVDHVVSGELSGDDILVAHWGILGGEKVLKKAPEIGGVYQLELERFDANPQLESERMDMDTTAFDLPMYYDPEPGIGSPIPAGGGGGAG